ncbi:PaaI family thioesterase [Blastococcus sp. CCUG 61487]|uniref:PaaI family thioesterase n=1 Tax=Blastococcus sp. CCUG 61487 TaxID=1840703 RepID=UPI0010C1580E|nr:PaaI family thioesterase [Blastococcus sp. CCUG 61487]
MRNMDRWLGDGGMPLLAAVGVTFERYGATEDPVTGWAEASWTPVPLAGNPHGLVQGGVHSVVLDAAMNFAVNAALPGRDRTQASLEMKTEWLRPARPGDALLVRGELVRAARQVAFAEGRVLSSDGTLLSRSTSTFLLHREQSATA